MAFSEGLVGIKTNFAHAWDRGGKAHGIFVGMRHREEPEL